MSQNTEYHSRAR